MPTKPLKKIHTPTILPSNQGWFGTSNNRTPLRFSLPILFPYHSQICFFGIWDWDDSYGSQGVPCPIGGPWRSKSSTWIQSPNWPKSKVRSTSSRWGVQNHGSSWGARYRPDFRGSMTGCFWWADYSPKSLKPLVGNVKIIQSETQACWIHEDFGWFGWVFLSFWGGPGWLVGILILAYYNP